MEAVSLPLPALLMALMTSPTDWLSAQCQADGAAVAQSHLEIGAAAAGIGGVDGAYAQPVVQRIQGGIRPDGIDVGPGDGGPVGGGIGYTGVLGRRASPMSWTVSDPAVPLLVSVSTR